MATRKSRSPASRAPKAKRPKASAAKQGVRQPLVRMALDDLKPAPYNPRKISATALKGLRASLKRFGLVQPIVFNRRTGHVVGGHQRVLALRESGETQADVLVVDLAEKDERALNVTLNNPKIAGDFTDEIDAMLAELQEQDSQMMHDLRLDALLPPVDEDEVAEIGHATRLEVVVTVENEHDQESLYRRLKEEGWAVRVLAL